MRIPGLVVVGGLLLGATGTILLHLDGHVPETRVVESESRIVNAPLGGIVEVALVKAGDRVTAGQMLIRLRETEFDERMRRVQSILERNPPDTVATAGTLMGRISPKVWRQLTATDPQLLAAEQDYVDAAKFAEQDHSPAAEATLKRASARRLAMQRRIAQIRPGAMESFGDLYLRTAEDLNWLSRQRAAAEVRAPFAGTIEIMDLHPGDVLAPLARVALLACNSCLPEVR
jgi:multidrug efflux pump subunit AcrA (membrane-fusion protein)